ncbi:carbohydrate ABC transporter permease [Glycomyces algeriensis]|uniref:Permease n=1 Tax=Glycomyces algeriensis TaxID=256037 RepID=A0A9W6LH28_9ACTN|nr:sugar ABC transporter permease [Glycomyces algeriensis]MDA1364472.1 sugar ABC transporter permease [Glycomyces algeriensis]MDR7350505.1 multiple sugar transport system permease protein [Glycomyces algeriensis]GLI43213.1 permease [Glycomyces algeriensis]
MTSDQTTLNRPEERLRRSSGPDRAAPKRPKDPFARSAAGFIAPGVILVAVLLYLPLLWTTFLSLTEYNGLGDPEWVGFANYLEMFDDPGFIGSVLNTLLWVAGTLLVPVGIGLGVALLTWNLKGGTWLRLPFLIPYALSGIGVGVIWSFILSGDGALDQALAAFGIQDTPRWLVDAPLNTVVMILATAWQGVGVNALLFTIGLQSIPKEPLEAARVDGANGLRLFRSILWPMLRPLTAVVVGLSIVASLKTFDIVQGMTKGGPGRASETLALTMYKETFVNSEYGLGSAIAVFLTVVTLAASILYLRQQLSSKHGV